MNAGNDYYAAGESVRLAQLFIAKRKRGSNDCLAKFIRVVLIGPESGRTIEKTRIVEFELQKPRCRPERAALPELQPTMFPNPVGHEFQHFRSKSFFDASILGRSAGNAVLEQVIEAGDFGGLKILVAAVLQRFVNRR